MGRLASLHRRFYRETTREAYVVWLAQRVALCYRWLETEVLGYYGVNLRRGTIAPGHMWYVCSTCLGFRSVGVLEYLGGRSLPLFGVFVAHMAPDLIQVDVECWEEDLAPAAFWLEADSIAAFGRMSLKQRIRSALTSAAHAHARQPVDAVRARMRDLAGRVPSSRRIGGLPCAVACLETDSPSYLEWLEKEAERQHVSFWPPEGVHISCARSRLR